MVDGNHLDSYLSERFLSSITSCVMSDEKISKKYKNTMINHYKNMNRMPNEPAWSLGSSALIQAR